MASEPVELEQEHGDTFEEEQYQEGDVTRLEDLCIITGQNRCLIVVADHANGLLIFDKEGQLKQHLNGDHDTLAFSVRYDRIRDELQSLVLDVPGWTLNVYKEVASPEDGQVRWTLDRLTLLPTKPDVARMKLRWLTVGARGDTYVMAAGNVWILRRKDDETEWTWDLVHHDQRKQAWFSHLTPMPTPDKDSEKFMVCWKGDTLRKAVLSDDEGLVVDRQSLLPEEVKEMGAFTVDEKGNLLISDWNTGNIFQCDDGYKKLNILGNVGEAEAYVMAAHAGKVFVGCKASLQVRAFSY